MNKKEKEILKKIVEHPDGLLAPTSFINSICKQDKKLAHKLIALRYIEEVPQTIPTGREIPFYRATEKGHSIFYPTHKRLWYHMKGDVRTIIVAAVVSLITAVISLILLK